ncbi:MAG TPA: hypothetical protein VKR38_14280 [Usitatibacter sp.]|nr:hypothetical protein [Usitatibacter sp.]
MASLAPEKLRIGVVADSALQPGWIVEALAKVASSGFAELAILSCESRRPARAPVERKPSSIPAILWSSYEGLDRAAFGGGARWSRPMDIARLVAPARRGPISSYEGDALDVIFAIGDVDDSSLDGKARNGVWRYCFGEGHGTREASAGVREVIDGAPVTASGIRVRLGEGADRIVYQSWSRTVPISVTKSRGNVFAKAAEFPVRALRELHAGGASWLAGKTIPAAAPATETSSRALDVVRDISRMGARVARRAGQKALAVEQWSLAFRFTPIEPWTGMLDGFFRLEPPPDRFWADPFPVQRGGKNYIFFEELPFGAGKAHISVVEVDRAGRASPPVRVLERDYHLSYPFLVEDRGDLYMIPETAQNGSVEIYRCVEFPHKWRRERALLEGIRAADATVHREGGRWWMFVNCAPEAFEIHDELHLFSSESLLGDWRPHRRNPVKSDVRSARPAGQLFRRGGKLYRPSQICAPLYGSGIAINHVTRLDSADFSEETERRIVPATGSPILGLHTINRSGDLSVMDAFARRRRF